MSYSQQTSDNTNTNTSETILDELGLIVDPIRGRFWNKFTACPIVPYIEHTKGASLSVRVPYNLGTNDVFGKGRNISAGRIVCYVRYGAPADLKCFAYHLDSDFMNCRGDNLMWDNGRHAAQQAILSGRQDCKMLMHVGTVRKLHSAGVRHVDAMASVFGVHPSTIKNIVKGATFSYVTTDQSDMVPGSILARLERQMELWNQRDVSFRDDHTSE